MKTTESRPTIYLRTNYYVSLCWYGLQQLGFNGGTVNSVYDAWAKEFETLGEVFGFRAPLAGGPLFAFLYQIPGSLDPQDPDELQGIMEAGCQYLRFGSISVFLTQWPEKTRHWDLWYNRAFRERTLRAFVNKEIAACKAIERWTEFMYVLWPLYRAEYEEKLRNYSFGEYQRRCNALNVFEKWAEELQLSYPYTDFSLIICPESPTQASRLGPEKVVLGAKHGWEQMRHSVIHEIGVRFMPLYRLSQNPRTAGIVREDYFGMLKLIEAEICFRKPRLLPDLQSDSFLTGMNLQTLVEWRARRGETDPDWVSYFADLYRQARADEVL